MEHPEIGGVPDRPAGIEQSPGQVGLLHRVEESRVEPVDFVERRRPDDGCATDEVRHRTRPLGRPGTQSRDVAPLRAALFVDEPDRHGAEPRVGLEPVDDRSQQPRVEEFSVVVEEHDEARIGRGCADVAAAGDAHVLGEHDEPIGLDGPTCGGAAPLTTSTNCGSTCCCARTEAIARASSVGRVPCVSTTTAISYLGARSSPSQASPPPPQDGGREVRQRSRPDVPERRRHGSATSGSRAAVAGRPRISSGRRGSGRGDGAAPDQPLTSQRLSSLPVRATKSATYLARNAE